MTILRCNPKQRMKPKKYQIKTTYWPGGNQSSVMLFSAIVFSFTGLLISTLIVFTLAPIIQLCALWADGEHTTCVKSIAVMLRIILMQIQEENMNLSYILNIDLQCFFIVVKVLGELKALVIKGEDRLKEGQHLKKDQDT